jgi:uncharacterized protein DUF3467
MAESAKSLSPTGEQNINVSELETTNPDNVRPVYSNHAGVQVSTWDIRIMFAEITPVVGGNEIQQRANVVMTPAHAKALAYLLAQHIEIYEQANGEIPWPPKAAGKSAAARKSRHPQSR